MQQKFLLVVSSVIVGLAILSGLRMAQENLRQANQDGITEDLLAIAGRAQVWYRIPAQRGGGGGSFANLTLSAITFDSINGNGSFVLSDLRQDSFRITGIGTEESSLRITLEVFSDSISSMQISP